MSAGAVGWPRGEGGLGKGLNSFKLYKCTRDFCRRGARFQAVCGGGGADGGGGRESYLEFGGHVNELELPHDGGARKVKKVVSPLG